MIHYKTNLGSTQRILSVNSIFNTFVTNRRHHALINTDKRSSFGTVTLLLLLLFCWKSELRVFDKISRAGPLPTNLGMCLSVLIFILLINGFLFVVACCMLLFCFSVSAHCLYVSQTIPSNLRTLSLSLSSDIGLNSLRHS